MGKIITDSVDSCVEMQSKHTRGKDLNLLPRASLPDTFPLHRCEGIIMIYFKAINILSLQEVSVNAHVECTYIH